jgi:hypothetical protein
LLRLYWDKGPQRRNGALFRNNKIGQATGFALN